MPPEHATDNNGQCHFWYSAFQILATPLTHHSIPSAAAGFLRRLIVGNNFEEEFHAKESNGKEIGGGKPERLPLKLTFSEAGCLVDGKVVRNRLLLQRHENCNVSSFCAFSPF